MTGQHFRRAATFERHSPGERVERGDAERIEIRSRVDVAAERLFGAHELRRAGDAVARVTRDRGDPEIGDQRTTGGRFEQDVVRLHVAMHDALRVRVGQRPRDLADQPYAIAGRHRATLPNALGERFPFDERHHVEDEAVDLVDGMNRDYVRVRQLGGEPRFAQEAVAQSLRLVGREELDRDEAVEVDLAREIDDSHPAATQLANDRIATRQGELEGVKERVGGVRGPQVVTPRRDVGWTPRNR